MQRSLKSFLVVVTAAALVLSPATASLAQSEAPVRVADRAVPAPAVTASAVAAASKPSPSKFAKKVNRYAKKKVRAARVTSALSWALPVKTSKKRDWWVRPTNGKGYKLGNEAVGMSASQATVTRYRKAVVKAFTRNGLRLTGTVRGYGGVVTKGFASSRYACTVTYETENPRYSTGASFWCTTKAKANSAVKKAAPLAAAYRRTAGTKGLIFDLPRIGASASSSYRDYRKASVGMGPVSGAGGFVGKFAKAPGQSWQFVVGVQAVISCEAWEKTSTGSRAWAGEPCWRGDYATGYEDTVRPW